MTRFAQMFTRIAVAMLIVAAPQVAAAQTADSPSLTWLAASSPEPTISTAWGRLTMKQGVLAFRSSDSEWDVPVSEIRRAAISESSDRLMIIERADGSVFYVAIFGTGMIVESPKKAVDMIQRAQRGTVSRRY